MKRVIAIAVVFCGLLAAYYSGGTRATKYLTENANGEIALDVTAGQRLLDLEITQAEIERSNKGLAIAPVPLRAGFGRTRFLVGLGSYLVNAVGGCNDCHTSPSYAPGGNPFQGQPEKINTQNYLAGGQRFGPFTSRNITPDPKEGNRPAGLSLNEFLETMRKGIDHDKLHPQISPLLQVMPWPVYGKMTDRDLTAIYYYLSAIPHAEPPAAP
ncbi:MAG TPA: hypothetical protein VNQ79_18340 [Blastocatellia bacterium]|nr:hypothetical protein [Blastocatellia bacterium]